MNHKKKINLLVVGCLLVALIAAVFTVGCPTPPETTTPPATTTPPPTKTTTPPAEEHLKVGVVMPISGPISTVGMAWVRGFELYFDKLNANGGVQIGNTTYFLDCVSEDNKVNPEAAGTAAQKLVFQDGAKFVFGCILEQNTQAVYDICVANDVLHLITWVNVPFHPADISPDKPLCTRPMISPQDSHRPVLEYLLEKYPDVKTLALSVPDIAVGTLDEDCRTIATELGIEVLGTEIWEFGTTDFIPLYTKVLAYKADAIIALTSAQAHYQLMSARQLGFTGPFASTSPLGPDVFLAVAGPEACTDVICAGWNPATATGALKDVVDGWQAEYGGEPFISDASFAWDCGWILIQAMQQAQSVDPATVLATLDTMTTPGSLQTGFGPAHMGGLETYGANRVLVRPIPVSYLMDGQIVDTVFMPIEVK
jgi:branched-chain amino acid transport system substrate-binding protein